jgi:hypothetical protein
MLSFWLCDQFDTKCVGLSHSFVFYSNFIEKIGYTVKAA